VKNKDIKILNQVVIILELNRPCFLLSLILKGPSLKEKSILLVKMMQFIEKRFPEDADLNAQVPFCFISFFILAWFRKMFSFLVFTSG